MNRREFIIASGTAAIAASQVGAAPQSQPATTATSQPSKLPADIEWHNVQDWGVEGRAFDDTLDYFDRLPKRAKGVVREEVWGLSRHTAGMSVRFTTDADAIYIRYAVLNKNLAMPHMPATGLSGVDLYGQGDDANWHYVRTVSPTDQTIEKLIQDGIAPGKRVYLMHLPLYNGVKSLDIGVARSASFKGIPPRKEKSILFYGTSITQGGCASRPGMAFTNILARRINVPFLNFGFSGNGRMELDVAKFLVEIDAALFVLDCSANCTPDMITARAEPLVKFIRDARKEMPILLLDERRPTNTPMLAAADKMHDAKSAALKAAFDHLVAGGIEKLHYRGDEAFLGIDGEAAVDGSHPTDLGMMRYAEALEPTLRDVRSAN